MHSSLLTVEGFGDLEIDESGVDFIGSIDALGPASITSLRHALTKFSRSLPEPGRHGIHPLTGERISIGTYVNPARVRVSVVDVPPEKFSQRHSYEFVPEPVDVVLLQDNEVGVSFSVVVPGEEEPQKAEVVAPLSAFLEKSGTRVVAVEISPEGPETFRSNLRVTNADFWIATIYLAVPSRGQNVASALQLGSDALVTLEAAAGGGLTRESAGDLIEAGRADLLVGQDENEWFEAKGQLYERSDKGRLELAKDVSSFANRAGGGLLVIGMRTKKVNGTDQVHAVRPLSIGDSVPSAYRKWLGRTVFPRIEGLKIRKLEYGSDRSLLLIDIPPQPLALRPFLVHGIVKDGSVMGNHFAIHVRDSDAAVSSGIAELHSLILAGRAALGYVDEMPGRAEL